MRSGTFNGDLLRQMRERRIGRQQDLAELLGVTMYTINRWENGKAEPSARYYVRLQEVLDCGPDDLMIEDGEVTTHP